MINDNFSHWQNMFAAALVPYGSRCHEDVSPYHGQALQLCCIGFVLGKANSLLLFSKLKTRRALAVAHLVAVIASDLKITH